MKKIQIGFSIWMELHKLERELDDMDSEQFQKTIDVAIKKWIDYDWLQEQIKKSRVHTRMEDGLSKLESLLKHELEERVRKVEQ